jgi:hypothetical protein
MVAGRRHVRSHARVAYSDPGGSLNALTTLTERMN